MQWLALLLAAERVPLAAHYFPQPELHALQILLAVQFSWTAILFPILCRKWQMSVVTLGAGWVMLLLAAALSAAPAGAVLPAAGSLALWVLGLWLWARLLRSDWLRIIASSLIAAFTVGGPILWYLGRDLGPAPSEVATWKFGPLLGLLLHPVSPPIAVWLILFLMAFSAVSLCLVGRFLAPSTLPHC